MLDARAATDPVRHPAQLLTSFTRAKSRPSTRHEFTTGGQHHLFYYFKSQVITNISAVEVAITTRAASLVPRRHRGGGAGGGLRPMTRREQGVTVSAARDDRNAEQPPFHTDLPKLLR